MESLFTERTAKCIPPDFSIDKAPCNCYILRQSKGVQYKDKNAFFALLEYVDTIVRRHERFTGESKQLCPFVLPLMPLLRQHFSV